MATERKRPVISDGLPSQLPDIDPQETSEWVESLDGVIDEGGTTRARYVMLRLPSGPVAHVVSRRSPRPTTSTQSLRARALGPRD